jgi:hypothetical protein
MTAAVNGSGRSRGRTVAGTLLECPVVYVGGDINSEHSLYGYRSENDRRLRLKYSPALVQGVSSAIIILI